MANRTSCPCTGETLAKLIHPVILTILADEPLHGYRIAELASEMPVLGGSRPDVAGLYHVLRSMEKSGYVEVMPQFSDKGPARKAYRLTASGRACLMTWIKTLSRYHKAVGALLEMARRTQRGTRQKAGRKRRRS